MQTENMPSPLRALHDKEFITLIGDTVRGILLGQLVRSPRRVHDVLAKGRTGYPRVLCGLFLV